MAESSGGSIDVLVEETEDVSVNQVRGSKFDYIFFLKMKVWLWNSTFVENGTLTLISLGFLRVGFSGGSQFDPSLHISRRTNLISV